MPLNPAQPIMPLNLAGLLIGWLLKSGPWPLIENSPGTVPAPSPAAGPLSFCSDPILRREAPRRRLHSPALRRVGFNRPAMGLSRRFLNLIVDSRTIPGVKSLCCMDLNLRRHSLFFDTATPPARKKTTTRTRAPKGNALAFNKI